MAKKRVLDSRESISNKKGSIVDTSWVIDALFDESSICRWFSIGKEQSDKQLVLKSCAHEAGFRVSLVSNPRAGVSIYTDNKLFTNYKDVPHIHQIFWLMIGLHPEQAAYEESYQVERSRFVILEVIRQLRLVPSCSKSSEVMKCLKSLEEKAKDFSKVFVEEWKQAIVSILVEKSAFSESIVLRDLDRTIHRNSTLSNSLLGVFIKIQKILIHGISLTKSSSSDFSRLNVFLYDELTDYLKPLPFLFKPGLSLLFSNNGLETLVNTFVEQFWSNVTSAGYIPCESLTTPFNPMLIAWVRSGVLLSNGSFQTAAAFEPKNCPLSMYLCGLPGAGKSSFVRTLTTALGKTINQLLDPQMEVRLVKFNLNKPLRVLKKELQLRPNNNDLSVMSIIQGRRQTFAQVKRGIVVIALEEVPSSNGSIESSGSRIDDELDELDVMEQESTLEHLSLRFCGIDKDTTLLPLFTSNYPLSDTSRRFLYDLSMFKGMTEIEMGAVNGKDRVALSDNFIDASIRTQSNRLSANSTFKSIEMSESLQEAGDIRPLRYKLNVLGFFVALEANRAVNKSGKVDCCSLKLSQFHDKETKCEVIEYIISSDSRTFPIITEKLEVYENGGFYPNITSHSLHDERASIVFSSLKSLFGNNGGDSIMDCWRISVIVDLFFNRALCPAVVVFKGKDKLSSALVSLLCSGTLEQELSGDVSDWCEGVLDIDPACINMVRSLYDSRDSRNLRDDIITAKAQSKDGNVCVEICNALPESQLLIRELVEDSPSMTSFSTANSALHKDGLFFVVNMKEDDILTPEFRSRVSLALFQ